MTPATDQYDQLALPKGARVLEFEIERVIGRGGFSIVYLAFDHSLHRRVALKEYLPQTLARRDATQSVVPFSSKHRETFDIGLKSFLEEARLLARFDHPALVKVFRFWPASGTAYMAMAYYEGLTLREAFVGGGTRPAPRIVEALTARLLDAVELLHRNECLHRDIAPDNVILQRNGNPVLLDFGAARRIIHERTQALTVILKTGYAPIEQYSVEGEMAQGPWTDVYALAATLYAIITGKGPPASVSRAYNDPYVPLAQAAPPGYSPRFADGIDRALAFLPEQRLQSIAALREVLGVVERPKPPAQRPSGETTVRMAPPSPPPDDATVLVPPPPPRRAARHRARNLALGATVLALVGLVALAVLHRGRDEAIAPPAETQVAARDSAPAPATMPPSTAPPIPPLVVQALPPRAEPPPKLAATPMEAPPKPAAPVPAPSVPAPSVPAPRAAEPEKPAPSLIPSPAPAAPPPSAEPPPVVAKADVAPRAPAEALDPAEAIKAVRRAAEEGDARAQNSLGFAYQNGNGVAVDYAAARRWYEASAAQGHAAAQNNLGNLHAAGLGMARNPVLAAEWYRKSADQGYALAQNNLGLMLENGRGTFRDPAAAAELYRRAAESGNINAMYNLARLYESGTGVPKSRTDALKWLHAAAEKGQKSAIAKLAELEGK